MLLKTCLSMLIPKESYGRIVPRSGVQWKKIINIGAGVADSDYTRKIGVVLFV